MINWNAGPWNSVFWGDWSRWDNDLYQNGTNAAGTWTTAFPPSASTILPPTLKSWTSLGTARSLNVNITETSTTPNITATVTESGGSVTPPTLQANYAFTGGFTNWEGENNPYQKIATFDVLTGDIIVVYGGTEGYSGGTISISNNGTALSWSQVAEGQDTGHCDTKIWSTVMAADRSSLIVTLTCTSGARFGGRVLVFRGASAVGVNNHAEMSVASDPSVTLTGVSDHSAIVMVNTDWSAVDPTGRTYNQTACSFNELDQHTDSGAYTVYGGYYGDTGSAGNKTIGITVPDGQTWAVIGLELEGTASGGGATNRQLLANIAETSTTPSVVETTSRKVTTNIADTSTTPSVVETTSRNLTVSITETSTTPNIVDGTFVFPTNSTLDNFNRASLGASWNLLLNTLAIQTSTVVYGVLGTNENIASYNALTVTNNFEVWATISAIAGTDAIRIGVLDGSNNGYGLVAQRGSGVQFSRIDSGSIIALGSVYSMTIASGDKLGLRRIGTLLEAWYCPNAGSWSRITTMTEATYTIGTSNLWLGVYNSSATTGATTADNFGGGVAFPTATTRQLLATISETSTTPSTSATLARTLQVILAETSSTPSSLATLLRKLTSGVVETSTTGDVALPVIGRKISTGIVEASTTGNVDSTITRKISTNIVETSTTPNSLATIARILFGNILESSTTSNVNTTLARILLANIVETSITPSVIGYANPIISQTNMKLSLVNGTTFVDFSTAGKLTPYLDKKLTITDSAGKKLVGYTKAAGSGETLGTEKLNNTTFEDTSSLWPINTAAMASVAGGQSGNCLRVTSNSDWDGVGQTFTTVNGVLYYFSGYEKVGNTGACYTAIQDGYVPYNNLGNTGFNSPVTWTQYSTYVTAISDTSIIDFSGWQAGDYEYYDTISLKQVLTPSTTGVTIVSTAGGSTYNWTSEESGFNRYDSNGYSYILEDVALSRQLLVNIADTSSTPNITATLQYIRALLTNIVETSTTSTASATLLRKILANIIESSSVATPVVITARLLSSAIAETSTTSSVISLLTRALIATINETSTTPSIARDLNRKLFTGIVETSTTPDAVPTTLARELFTGIAELSSTPNVTASMQGLIQLLTNIAESSTTPNTVAVITARKLATSILETSTTPTTVANIVRNILVTISETSTTPTISRDLLRKLTTAIIETSTTPNISVTLAGLIQLLVNIVETSSTPTTVNYTIARKIFTNIAESSSTPDIIRTLAQKLNVNITETSSTGNISVGMGAMIALVVAIAQTSSTPTVAVSMVRALLTALAVSSNTSNPVVTTIHKLFSGISETSSTSDILGNLLRKVNTNIVETSNTPIINIDLLRKLTAVISETSSTPSIGRLLTRLLTASVQEQSLTPDIISQLLRQLKVSIDEGSLTPNDLVLTLAILGIITEPGLFSVTPDFDFIVTTIERVITSTYGIDPTLSFIQETPKRGFISNTVQRGIEHKDDDI